MRKETMAPRQRWLAVYKHEPTDRTPMDYWGTDETGKKLVAHLGAANLDEALQKLHVDFIVGVGPVYVGPPIPKGMDVYGIQYRDIDYGSGVYSEAATHPLAKYQSVKEIEENYTWPNPDWWDYSTIRQQAEQWSDYPIRGGGSEPFLNYKYLRGDEQAMVDLVENPEIVHYCLDKMFELAYQNTLRIFEQIPGLVTCSYVAEDMGAQTDLMLSPKHIRQFLFPGMKRIIDLTHQAGAYAFHHNDGNCTRILPELVELGIDSLNPIQWRAAGMDRAMLKAKYGQKIAFHGGVDNQYTLPFGTVEEVRQEVRDNLRILGAGGGYILAPCHNIQPVTPMENILAMYETCYEEG
jgi:uroporphyrinogen decarboxylase